MTSILCLIAMLAGALGAFLIFLVAPAANTFIGGALYGAAGCCFWVMTIDIIIETIKRIRRKNERRT